MANSHPNSLTWRQSHLQLYSKLSTQFFPFLICLIPTEQTYICSQNSYFFLTSGQLILFSQNALPLATPPHVHTHHPSFKATHPNNAMTPSRRKAISYLLFYVRHFLPSAFWHHFKFS